MNKSTPKTELLATIYRKNLAYQAGERVKLLVEKGRMPEAVRAVEDVIATYNDSIEELLNNPALLPIDYCGLPRVLTEILFNHGYETVQDLLDDWPGRLLSKQNVEITGHYRVRRMLTRFGLINTKGDPNEKLPRTESAEPELSCIQPMAVEPPRQAPALASGGPGDHQARIHAEAESGIRSRHLEHPDRRDG